MGHASNAHAYETQSFDASKDSSPFRSHSSVTSPVIVVYRVVYRDVLSQAGTAILFYLVLPYKSD